MDGCFLGILKNEIHILPTSYSDMFVWPCQLVLMTSATTRLITWRWWWCVQDVFLTLRWAHISRGGIPQWPEIMSNMLREWKYPVVAALRISILFQVQLIDEHTRLLTGRNREDKRPHHDICFSTHVMWSYVSKCWQNTHKLVQFWNDIFRLPPALVPPKAFCTRSSCRHNHVFFDSRIVSSSISCL